MKDRMVDRMVERREERMKRWELESWAVEVIRVGGGECR